jgi:hypothetical protein
MLGVNTSTRLRYYTPAHDLFMRKIPDYLEIIDLRPGYLKAIIHGREISYPIEIKE